MFDWSPNKDPVSGRSTAVVAPAAPARPRSCCGNCGVAGHNRRTCPQLQPVQRVAEAVIGHPVGGRGRGRAPRRAHTRSLRQVAALRAVGGNWTWQYTTPREYNSLVRRFGPTTRTRVHAVGTSNQVEIGWVL
tara:strand:- start:22113 stop:22511 length:399 start_codon:yes stop_codon:yes gene_type:complete